MNSMSFVRHKTFDRYLLLADRVVACNVQLVGKVVGW
jgi:hypothetical protein